MQLNVDEPVFPLALLAILAGLRLAVYVAERLTRQAPVAAVAPALAPDAPLDEPAFRLGEAETATADDTLAAPLPASAPAETLHPFRALSELLDSGIIAVLLVFFIIRPFVLQAFYIPSGSMIPTLREGDKLLATKYEFRLRQPKRGEVVVFHAPEVALDMLRQPYDANHPIEYVKRVIGVPGDRIRIVANEGVYINGELQQEPYQQAPPDYNYPVDLNGQIAATYPNGNLPTISPREHIDLRPNVHARDGVLELKIPEGYLFVMGDNRTESHDSHAWGMLPMDRVVGKAFFIFWPLARSGFIH